MKRFLLILTLFGVLLPLRAQQYKLDPEASAAIRARLEAVHKDRPTVALVLSGGGAKSPPERHSSQGGRSSNMSICPGKLSQ